VASGYVPVTRSSVSVPASNEPLEPVRPLPYWLWQPLAFGFCEAGVV
jgi:hypothetical protein